MHWRHLGLLAVGLSLACADSPRAPVPPVARTPEEPALRWDAPAATSVHLPSSVVPTRYRLELTIDPRKESFSGKTTIHVDVLEPTDHIVLHGRDLRVRSVQVVHAGAPKEPLEAEVRPRRAFGAKDKDEELVLLLGRWLQPGKAHVEITYDAPFGSLWGLFRVQEAGRAFAFTQLEATFARRMFPSFDEPRHKTPFDVVLEVPMGMTAYANGKVLHQRALPEDMQRLTFDETPPIPTYLVAVAVGELERLEGAPVPAPIAVLTAPGKSKAGADGAEAARRTLAALEGYFDRKYPYGKLDLVAVPNFAVGAMENAGLVTFREELLLATASAPVSLRRRMILVMAHELAHQWFGNLVTMTWWDDIWLNEGFATWMQAKATDEAYPELRTQAERVLSKDLAMRYDALPSSRAVRPQVTRADDIGQIGGWSAYQKGASILAMLEAWAGEESFRDAIRAYVAKQAHKSITSTELFAALDAGTKKEVSRVAKTFLDQPGVPVFQVSLTCDQKTQGPVTVSVEPGALGGPPGARWDVPVCLRVQGETAPRCVLSRGAATSVKLDRCPGWVHPNAGEAGYYRYDLDAASWQKLTKAFAELPEAERAGLLLDAWALALAGRRGVEDVTSLLGSIDWKQERSRVVLEAAIVVLTELNRLNGAEAPKTYVALVRRVLEPARKRLALPKLGQKEPDDDALLRASVLAALHDLIRDPDVALALTPAGRAYVSDPAAAQALVGPDLAPLAARVAVATDEKAAGALDEKALLAARSPDHRVGLTIAIASRERPEALEAALDLLLSGSIRAGDVRHVKSAIGGRAKSREVFYRWAVRHFDELTEKLGGAPTLIQTIGWSCGRSPGVDALVAAVDRRLEKLDGARRAYEEGVADLERCASVRAQNR